MKQRTLKLDVTGRDVAPDVGDVLESDRRWYLVVDADMKAKYLHVLCDVYPKPPLKYDGEFYSFPSTDGVWWQLT